jgi:D-glycero-alpha-D-manno-heptose-7-phosphate kinase
LTTSEMKKPLLKSGDLPGYVVRAPVRINDIGGWTDTWFAGSGKVVNIAVDPGVEVLVRTGPNPGASPERITIHASNYGATFSMVPESPDYDQFPLLQGAVHMLPPPEKIRLDIFLKSEVPAGSAAGTSASVCVALLGALSAVREEVLSPDEAASLAHRVETELVGCQSGIQDQISAARGGICFIEMERYPIAKTENLFPSANFLDKLESRLCLVFLGQAHSSSAIHEEVIADLESNRSSRFKILDSLKGLAQEAKLAVLSEDLEMLGKIMVENTECQEKLHERLISPDAKRIISTARKFGSSGWKVNGAGGEGGSITLLASEEKSQKKRMIKAITSLGGGIRILPFTLNQTGLEIIRQP